MERAELVFIPAPGIGHLLSAVELAKLLTNRDQRLSITVLIMTLPFDTGVTVYSQSLRSNATARIRFVDLPRNSPTSTTPNSNSPMALLSAFIGTQITHIRDAVKTRSSDSAPLAGFVIDMFCTPMIDVANEFGLPTYVFFTSSAAFLGFKFQLLSLVDDHNQDITQYKHSHAELSIPSFANPVPTKVIPSVSMDKEYGGSAMTLAMTRRLRETKGIMVNTFLELESHALNSLHNTTPLIPIYPVGPLLHITTQNESSEAAIIMRWLDDQPPSSVVFLCFGSMGSFDEEQVKEIAHALERRGHRFLWSLRRPPPLQKGKMEMPKEYENPREVLPDGFLERTSETGKVIGWAPQVAVLSHSAVGGFVSHCGWNSILESLWCGVPVATWPIYAEQQINAFQMVVELKLAVEIKLDYRRDFYSGQNTVTVTAEEIERGIRGVMEGESEMRKNVKDMKEKSRMAMREGGSSYTSLGRLIEVVMDNVHQRS